ncbi:allantoinase AllB [Haloglycomyces albus]|uniref:allantoinase AllB n=1 Tax=Haloglycomyces albus TaxID=526067 RepID=UPI00046CB148|nr:allantoinase AllB [Haloglycomyces albus]
MRHDLVVRSQRTVFPNQERPAAVTVDDGVITSITGYDTELSAHHDVDYGELCLLPGLVDTHVHVNEPGRTHWEGYRTATRAAVAGGVTTILDMPLNSLPPTINPDALRLKHRTAPGQIHTDTGFWGGIVPHNLGRLAALHDKGVYGFKCFTSHSGVDEFPALSTEQLRDGLQEAAALDALVIVHAEDPHILDNAPTANTDFTGFIASRPVSAETAAVERVIALGKETGARLHILHVSAAATADLIVAARESGVDVTAETCPHYLCVNAEKVPDAATRFKCCPPIRDERNRDGLWQALADGGIDCVVSDHSPCPPELKDGDFADAWGGISSLQTGLSVVWTHARQRGIPLSRIVQWMCHAPARIAGLQSKGRLDRGADADFAVFDPDYEWTVDAPRLHHRHPVSPYHGDSLTGYVTATWLRGRLVGGRPHGRLLSKED